ncbi:MAG: putative dehydrogenase [Granulosicoccus sp.]|jgi:predicted dehydrogenase
MEKLKIGVLGAGHLGRIHIKILTETEGFEMIGFFDPDEDKSQQTIKDFNIKRFNSIDELVAQCDAVDVVTPTLSHYDCASQVIRGSKHVFIEKPVTNTLEEAEKLIKLANEANVKVQVGHVERFNPAFVAAEPFCDNPMFIEAHRLAQFNPRGTDVPVVMDLMIHDIDIVLSIVKGTVKKIHASGVPVVSHSPDIANARIEFDNGCVANLTASRISLKNMRKARIFQKDAYISVDMLDKKTEVVRMSDVEGNAAEGMFIELNDGTKRGINFELPEVKPTNAIQEELKCFRDAILNDTLPPVTMEDGYNALKVAHRIVERMHLGAGIMAQNI